MIRHLVREERDGGLWLIREQGRVVPLDRASYRLFDHLARDLTAGRLPDLQALSQTLSGDAPGLLPTLQEQGLDRPSASGHGLRLLPIGQAEIASLPVDAVRAPKRIYFELTRACNLSCRSCFNESRHPLPRELRLDEVLEVNRQAEEQGVFEIRYTGGECTTIPWFPLVVEDARRRGLYVSVGSNGVYSDQTLEWLPQSGIDWLILSLDGDREGNDRIRGRGTYDRIVHSLDHLARNSNMRIRINTVAARHNLDQLESIARLAGRHGVESINVIPLRPYGRSTRHMVKDMFSQADFLGFIHEINRLRRLFPAIRFSTTIDLLDPEATTSHDLMVEKKATCAAGVEACVLGPTGDVYGCSYSPASFPDSPDEQGRRVFVAGNLRQESLAHIWRDSSRWSVFRDLQGYKHPKCHGCDHYRVRCSGSCPIMAWYALGQDGAASHGAIADVCDPYCFADLMPPTAP